MKCSGCIIPLLFVPAAEAAGVEVSPTPVRPSPPDGPWLFL